MTVKSLIAGLSLLACSAAVTLPLQAAESTQQKVPSTFSSGELVVGDRAPAVYQRESEALHDWKKRGLRAPDEDSQWVKIKNQYVLVAITNGKIIELKPVKH